MTSRDHACVCAPADRAYIVPSPIDQGQHSGEEDNPFGADNLEEEHEFTPPGGEADVEFNPANPFWKETTPRPLDDNFFESLNKEVPAAKSLSWQKVSDDDIGAASNTAFAKDREWRGPPPGLNCEYWDDLPGNIEDLSGALQKSPTFD